MTLTAPTPITAERLERRNRERLARAESLLRRLESTDAPHTKDSVITPLNDFQVELSNLASECGIYIAMHPDPEVQQLAEKLQREAVDLGQRQLQSRALYDALISIDQASLGTVDRRLVDLVRLDMRRAGVELAPADRARARELRAELTRLGQDHARNIRSDTRHIALEGPHELDGLPADYVATHQAGPDGVIRISTSPPDHAPFMTYAHSDRARRALHTVYQDRAPQNLEVLAALTRTRHELARNLGYPTWAHYNLEDRMVRTPEALERFFVELDEASEEAAKAEVAVLVEEKRTDQPGATTVGDWEWQYYLNRVKAKRFRFDAQAVRPYLEYGRVRQAILDLNAELFGMTFTPVVHEERWHPSVESYDVTIDGEPAGRVSLDMHPREGKNKWFFNAPLRPAVGGKQPGHGVLNCNFPDPGTLSGPALMEHGHVVTYFHEFGHLVHGLARRSVPYIRMSRTEGDFMEAPSTFLEDWIYDHGVLMRFATHVDTGAPIPAELVERLRAARNFGRAIRTRQMLMRSRLSLALHDGTRPGDDPRAVEKDINERYGLFEAIPGTASPANWEHMNSDHYSAAYYTYIWSQTIAKDLHTAFDGDLMNTAVSLRYRDKVLAPGGTKPAAELVQDFLGRPYDLRAFKEWLAGGA
ncbi:MAG TPA: M3 family metallopeptidase [Gemmatimonadaceae bacterium]|nr:M3 family metallopeptidase [Gemmatimonadaceae bacterium]